MTLTVRTGIACLLLLTAANLALAETHANVQAVDAEGKGTFSGPATLTGVILNNPEEMLDSTAGFLPYDGGANMGRIGGQWQIFIQSVDPADQGGTACWMGQNYGNTWRKSTDYSYTDADWQAEMNRVNHDPDSGHLFRKGDLVQVTASHTGFYGGKTNVNEGHDNHPDLNFQITLIQADYGLPTPTVVELSDLKNASDQAIFDATRQSGGERYQGELIRINDVTLSDASGWGQEAWGDRLCEITDATGRTFKLRMPRGSVVDFGSAPIGEFDVTGILNQESGSGAMGVDGYELFVTAVPEPGTLTLLATAGMALLRRRRK